MTIKYDIVYQMSKGRFKRFKRKSGENSITLNP